MLHRRDARYGVGVLVWTVLMMTVLGVVTRLVLAASERTGPWLEHVALVGALARAIAAFAGVLRTDTPTAIAASSLVIQSAILRWNLRSIFCRIGG